jgi:hypothetical protein
MAGSNFNQGPRHASAAECQSSCPLIRSPWRHGAVRASQESVATSGDWCHGRSDNTLFVTVYGNADALGDLTATNAITKTFAGGRVAIGFAGATAVAEGTTTVAPYTDATTDGLADGGFITSSHTSHRSIDFPYGSTPVSVSVSMTYVATHGVGDFLSGYSLSGLASPSVHGLL